MARTKCTARRETGRRLTAAEKAAVQLYLEEQRKREEEDEEEEELWETDTEGEEAGDSAGEQELAHGETSPCASPAPAPTQEQAPAAAAAELAAVHQTPAAAQQQQQQQSVSHVSATPADSYEALWASIAPLLETPSSQQVTSLPTACH